MLNEEKNNTRLMSTKGSIDLICFLYLIRFAHNFLHLRVLWYQFCLYLSARGVNRLFRSVLC